MRSCKKCEYIAEKPEFVYCPLCGDVLIENPPPKLNIGFERDLQRELNRTTQKIEPKKADDKYKFDC